MANSAYAGGASLVHRPRRSICSPWRRSPSPCSSRAAGAAPGNAVAVTFRGPTRCPDSPARLPRGAACNATAGCIGFVYQGAEGGDRCSGVAPRCFLKEKLSHGSAGRSCTCHGENGRPGPRSPAPAPAPAPRCPRCLATEGFVGGEWHPSNASNSLWMAPKFLAGYMAGPVPHDLAVTAAAGFTAIRVFLNTVAYDADPKAGGAIHRAPTWTRSMARVPILSVLTDSPPPPPTHTHTHTCSRTPQAFVANLGSFIAAVDAAGLR